MGDQLTLKKKKFTNLEIIALSASIFIITVGVVYWVLQIRGVLEMLEMAYG